MNKENEYRLVPRLRFPEFKKNGEWKEKCMGEVTYPASEKNKDGNKYPIYSISNISGFVPQSEQFEGVDSHKRGYDVTLYKIIKKNTFAYNPARINIGSLGYSGELNDVIISSLYVCFKTANDLDDLFLLHFFKTSIFNKSVKQKVEGGIRSYLFYENFATIIIQFPSKPEQQKIALCLSSLDEVITDESQKLDILRVHKKGLLQNLLPQEGEIAPKFRYKEFEENGDWDETTLTQVADYENGKAHEQDIDSDGDFIVVNSKFISQDGEVTKFTNTAFCPAMKGDVLMVLSDIPNGKAIAKCFLVEEDNRYTVNQRICRITPRNLNSKILYYLLNRNPYFLAFDDGVKQTNLRKEDVLNCPLLIPSDPKEQEKIADTLSSIDDLIKAQNQKVEALKLHKKGLLQGLFPDVNGVNE